MQKNRFIFGVRTPKVVQATGGPKLSARMTTSVEVGFTVTRKKQGRACGKKGRESAAGHIQGAIGCRLHVMVAKELRRICEVLESENGLGWEGRLTIM